MSIIPENALKEIRGVVTQSNGNSHLYEYDDSGYKDGVRHWLRSSTEVAECVFVPGNVNDLAAIIKIIGKYKFPFAIKGGGHATSPKLSSSNGLLIYLVRFDEVSFDEKSQTISVGGGCLWEQVYREAWKFERGVIGGSTSEGVGVGGWMMGGGYSLRSNRYGLGIDNVVRFQVVLPNGEVTEVDENDSRKDLFEALKGGGNNFGIVTRFTLETQPQSEKVYTGRFRFNKPEYDRAKDHIIKFTQGDMTDAAIVAVFSRTPKGGQSGGIKSSFSVFCLYHGDTPSQNPFQGFLNISPNGYNKNTATDDDEKDQDDDLGLKVMQYLDMDRRAFLFRYHGCSSDDLIPGSESTPSTGPVRKPRSLPTSNPAMNGVGEVNGRGRFACVMLRRYTKRLIDEIDRQVMISATYLKALDGIEVSMDVWPFGPKIFNRSKDAAWPHPQGNSYGPCLAYYRWNNQKDDVAWLNEMTRALQAIWNAAVLEGCTDSNVPFYSNTSLNTVNPTEIYKGNYERLRIIRSKYDPNDVMSNAAGFRIPLPDPPGSTNNTNTNPNDTPTPSPEELKKISVDRYNKYGGNKAATGFFHRAFNGQRSVRIVAVDLDLEFVDSAEFGTAFEGTLFFNDVTQLNGSVNYRFWYNTNITDNEAAVVVQFYLTGASTFIAEFVASDPARIMKAVVSGRSGNWNPSQYQRNPAKVTKNTNSGSITLSNRISDQTATWSAPVNANLVAFNQLGRLLVKNVNAIRTGQTSFVDYNDDRILFYPTASDSDFSAVFYPTIPKGGDLQALRGQSVGTIGAGTRATWT